MLIGAAYIPTKENYEDEEVMDLECIKSEWTLADLERRVSAAEMPDYNDLPETIDLGYDLSSEIEANAKAAYTLLDEQGSYDQINWTFFHKTNNIRIMGETTLDTLYYARGIKLGTRVEESWPPELQFLMPVLEYCYVKDQRKGQAMLLSSVDATLLAVRSAQTPLLHNGGRVDPINSRQMRVPRGYEQNLPYHSFGLFSRARNIEAAAYSMDTFLNACEQLNLAIYGTETSRSDQNRGLLRRLEITPA